MLQLEIELDHLGSTGDHWETLSGSYPIWKWVGGSNQYLSNFSFSPWYNFSEDMFYLSLVICDVLVFSFQMKVWTLMIQMNLMIPGIEWKGNEWTLIIQKSMVIHASPMVLFSFKS